MYSKGVEQERTVSAFRTGIGISLRGTQSVRLQRLALGLDYLLTTARREGPILDEEQVPKDHRYPGVVWIREPGSLFTSIQADCWSDANAVSPRNFVVLSVKNKFA